MIEDIGLSTRPSTDELIGSTDRPSRALLKMKEELLRLAIALRKVLDCGGEGLLGVHNSHST